MYKKAKAQNLKNNLKYLIKSRGETQISLCSSSGLTRSTIYNILEGRVVNVQQSTVRKISDFFGVSYTEIETVDFEEKESVECEISFVGNVNPSAVPVIKERLLIQIKDKGIGELVTTHPLTYYFGTACNVIGVLLENGIPGLNDPGDLLIVQKGLTCSSRDKLIYDKKTKRLFVGTQTCFDPDEFFVIGDILEERYNG